MQFFRLVGFLAPGGCGAVLLVAFLLLSGATAQETPAKLSPQQYLEQVLELMEKNALHKDSIDWKHVTAETLARAQGAVTTEDTYPAIAYALTQLKERHSWLQFPDNLPEARKQELAAEMAKVRTPPADSSPSPFSPQKTIAAHMDRRAGHMYAHVIVPMCIPKYAEWDKNGPDFQEFADKLHSLVLELQAQKPSGWMVDLRGNGGGNMWPMIAGIGAVLGEGTLGWSESSDGSRERWLYKAGAAIDADQNAPEVIASKVQTPPFAFPDLPWVAVLVDRGTGSSGEAVAIAFAGRARSRSFGEHTAGFSTSNQMYSLPDGAALFLCVGIEANRNGRRYPDGIVPDVVLPAATSRPSEDKDPVLQAAMEWLAKK